MSYATVRIENKGRSSNETTIVDAKTGARIRPVTHIDIHVERDTMLEIKLTLERGWFLLEGKPTILTALQQIADEMRHVAVRSSFEGSPPVSYRQIAEWAGAIMGQIAIATGLTREPEP